MAVRLRVGIPRALFYYYYYPAWQAFFNELGAEVVVSFPTHRGILEAGIETAVSETCLPVKVFYGHVHELAPKVDLMFVPRLVSVEKRTYICPKFMGLPDMIRASFSHLPPIIDWCVDLRRSQKNQKRELWRVARLFTRSPLKFYRALRAAQESMRCFQCYLERGFLPPEALEKMVSGKAYRQGCHSGGCQPNSANSADGVRGNLDAGEKNENEKEGDRLTVALLGHGYTLYDDFISRGVIGKLRHLGARVVTQDMLPERIINEKASLLPKRMFWTLGKKIMGGALHFISSPDIAGIIHVSCFGCGPDSLVAELVEITSRRRQRVPFMLLTLDEHSGEAGIVTRLEAFLDLVRRRRGCRL